MQEQLSCEAKITLFKGEILQLNVIFKNASLRSLICKSQFVLALKNFVDSLYFICEQRIMHALLCTLYLRGSILLLIK